jgi:hypothetical protein
MATEVRVQFAVDAPTAVPPAGRKSKPAVVRITLRLTNEA